MTKIFSLSLIVTCFGISAANAACKFADAVKPFKADLERVYFNGQSVDFRIVTSMATLPPFASGTYDFIANNGLWTGKMYVDLSNCTVSSGSNHIWRTLDLNGNP